MNIENQINRNESIMPTYHTSKWNFLFDLQFYTPSFYQFNVHIIIIYTDREREREREPLYSLDVQIVQALNTR